MELKFVEAGQAPEGGGNWGKFAVARWSTLEMREPTRFPGCEGQFITGLTGSPFDHIWLLDIQAGEGALFSINNPIPVDVPHQLNEKQIYICPMFEPFMTWLWEHIRSHQGTNLDWFDELPRVVVLPEAPFDLYGYRRRGRTSGGTELTPERLDELAAGAGYPPEKLRPRRRNLTYRSLDEDTEHAPAHVTDDIADQGG